MERNTQLASVHYESLRQYLADYLTTVSKARDSKSSVQRASARDKLTRLSVQQFNELSTDVFDEMNRRLTGASDGKKGGSQGRGSRAQAWLG